MANQYEVEEVKSNSDLASISISEEPEKVLIINEKHYKFPENPTRVEFTLGVYPGYNHDNSTYYGSKHNETSFYRAVMKYLESNADKFGMYIPFVVIPSRVLYKTEWGCPVEGEETYTFSAVCNPNFNDDNDKWLLAALLCADGLRQRFDQNTVTVTVFGSNGVNIFYLKK